MKFENKKNLKVKVKVQPTTQLVQCQRESGGRAGRAKLWRRQEDLAREGGGVEPLEPGGNVSHSSQHNWSWSWSWRCQLM